MSRKRAALALAAMLEAYLRLDALHGLVEGRCSAIDK